MLLAALVTVTMLAASGCRSCSSCHDYDPPVAEGYCDACGTHRCGSAGGCGCSSCSGGGGTTGGCNCGNHGGGYVEGGENAYGEGETSEGYPVEGE
jgi:hypothetical protein